MGILRASSYGHYTVYRVDYLAQSYIRFPQPFHLSGLTLTSGPSPLPASWTVHISENGTSFVPLVAFYSDDPSDCPGISSGDVMGEMVDILRVLEEELEVQCEEAPEGHTVSVASCM